MKDVFEKYLLLLRQDRGDKTEHSDRGALETLLNAAAQAADPGIRIIHEAKRVHGSGAPDFKIMKAAMILGYVENKTIGENLDQILKSDQIKRYGGGGSEGLVGCNPISKRPRPLVLQDQARIVFVEGQYRAR